MKNPLQRQVRVKLGLKMDFSSLCILYRDDVLDPGFEAERRNLPEVNGNNSFRLDKTFWANGTENHRVYIPPQSRLRSVATPAANALLLVLPRVMDPDP